MVPRKAPRTHRCGPWGSAKAGGLQVIISRYDIPQLIFGPAIAAIRIGVVPFHQHLEPGLDIGPFGVGLKAEHVQRPTLRIENLASLRCRTRMTIAAGCCFAKQTERVLGRPAGSATVTGPRALAAEGAQFPGRAMAGDRILLVFGDSVLAHAGEEIVGVVVFAHV